MSNDTSGHDPEDGSDQAAQGQDLLDEDLYLEPEELVDRADVDPLIGRVLNGRFDLKALIGEGGMGRVYEAVQIPLGRRVAIKVLHPTLPSSSDPHFQRRFLQEAALTARLHSPNTVSVLDYGQTEDGIYYLAMEYLEGDTLLQTLQRDGPLPWAQAVKVTQQICRSLKEAHGLGVVHRDLKPANIILVRDGEQLLVKVLDFGLVKTIAPVEGQVDPEITQQGTFLGSPTYMSPEQARNESDARSDVYSLGVLTFHMLMGRPPFVSADYVELLFAHHRQPPPSFRHLRPDLDVPPSLEAVVRKCLEKAPEARFQSMEDLMVALREASVASGMQSGIFRPSATGLHPLPHQSGNAAGPSQSGRTDVGPLFSAFTRLEPGMLPSVPEVGEESTRAYTLANDLGVVLSERVKANKVDRRLWIAGVALLLLLLIGVGGWMLSRAGAEDVLAAAPSLEEANLPPPTPGAVRFRVMSEPSGARVLLEGQDKGVTPFLLEVMPGEDGIATVELTFMKDGYQPDTVLTGGSGDVVLMRKLQRSRSRRTRAPRSAVAAKATRPSEEDADDDASGLGLPGGASLPTGAIVGLNSTASTVTPTPTVQREDVVPFGEGMEVPVRIAGPSLTLSREARVAGVTGSMILKCTIGAKGTVSNCRVIKPLPFMEEAVKTYITQGLYRPVRFNGKAVSVDYVFNVSIVPPKR